MQIIDLRIRNFKCIREMMLSDVENALILVGKNNTGKTAVLDAVRAVSGSYQIQEKDFREDFSNIEIMVSISIREEDLKEFHRKGLVSSYRRYETWYQDFRKKLPSFQNGILTFTFIANREEKIRYEDGIRKDNKYIPTIFPKIYYMDTQRDMKQFQEDLLLMQEDDLLRKMRRGSCIFDEAKKCSHCFSCIGWINQKTPEQINALEAAKLLEYKLYQLNLDEFSKQVNANFHKNGGQEEIRYSMNRDIERMLTVTAEMYHPKQGTLRPIGHMGKGMRSIYMLSLLETYALAEGKEPGLILVEEPEIFLHPKMQKVAGDILYQLSKKIRLCFLPIPLIYWRILTAGRFVRFLWRKMGIPVCVKKPISVRY